MVERVLGKDEVSGSIPLIGSRVLRREVKLPMIEEGSFAELAAMIEGVFSDSQQTENFLRMLEQNGTKLRDFERAMGDLPLGRAFAPGQRFSISSYDRLGSLDAKAKGELKQIYLEKVEHLESSNPELRRNYFRVFST